MATIEELEQKVDRLERDILAKEMKDDLLLEKADKAIDFASHAYKFDHYGFIWVWDVNQKGYRKTNMRIMTPEVSDESITNEKLANDSITASKIAKGAVTREKIADGAIEELTGMYDELDQKINHETSTRHDADTQLQVQINDIKGGSSGSIKSLQDEIDDIKGGSTDSIASLKESIAEEKARAEGVEATKANANDVYTRAQGTALEDSVSQSINQQNSNINSKFAEQNAILADQDEKMDNMQATINAKQLEIGAVETDMEPTENSGNFLTSGTVYNSFKHGGIYVDSPEFIEVKTDAEDKIIEGLREDGSKMIVGDTVIKGALNVSKGTNTDKVNIGGSTLENEDCPDLIQTTTDGDGKIVQSRSYDGVNKEHIGFETPKIHIDGNAIKNTDSSEFISIEADSENKVLGGRKADGTKVENTGFDLGSALLKGVENSEFIQATINSEGKVLEGLNPDGKKVLALPTNQDDKLSEDINELDKKVSDSLSKIVTSEEYNQVREDKCNNNVAYLIYSDSSTPFADLKVIKNGKIWQNISNRNYKTRIALFGDPHFGYTIDGSLVLDPTSEERCGMAFAFASEKNADFAVLFGDILQGGTNEQVLEMFNLYYQNMRKLAIPGFPIEGNHDECWVKVKHDEFIRTGVIEIGNVRIICFNAKYIDYSEGYGIENGDLTDEVFEWLTEAVRDSYENGFITILADHYPVYGTNNPPSGGIIVKHREDLISLCKQYDVKLYLCGHWHLPGLAHHIFDEGGETFDTTEVILGWAHVTYTIMEVDDNGFTLTEYDTMTDEVLHSLYIPMVNQAEGTIYR
jgi:predicted MPP superfamily phosphohydrolase